MERKSREISWTYVPNKGLLTKYGVKDILTIKDAFVKIMQFNDATSFNQRLDILVRREDGSSDYIKRRILSDYDEQEILEDFPGIKTSHKYSV